MSGARLAAIVALAVVVLVVLNVVMWRRMKAATAAGRAKGELAPSDRDDIRS